MGVQIKKVEPRRVAFVRHVGPYAEVGRAWDKLMPVMGKEGLVDGNTVCLGVCYDDPEITPPAKLRYDACVTIDEDFSGDGEIGVRIIPGGEYAVTTHVGPYTELGKTYAMLVGQWLPRSGRSLGTTPCYEVYLNSPESTAPEDLITDIYAPLV